MKTEEMASCSHDRVTSTDITLPAMNKYKPGQNLWANCFSSTGHWQYKAVILDRGEKHEINESWENLSLVDLHYKKYYREVFDLKGNDRKSDL